MATAPEDTGPRPNPYRDAGPYGVVEIGGVPVPGILQSVNGLDVEQEWNFQKAGGGGANANSATPDPQNGANQPATTTTGTQTAGSFGVSVWRGAKLAETITIKVKIVNAAQYDGWYDILALVMPKRGKKVPSHAFGHPDANAVGITRVAVKKVGMPQEENPGSGLRIGTIELCEYNPKKTAPAGKADPAKPGDAPKPKDAAEEELQRLMDEARK